MESKVAIITGGTKGIGAAIAERFLKKNIFTIVLAKDKKDNKEWLVKQKVNKYFRAEVYDCDISNYEKCKEIISIIEKKYQHIDILVNNAGIINDSVFIKMSKKDWDSVININLGSLYNITHPVVKSMIKKKFGRIVNISSINAEKGQFGQTNYAASKAGIIGFTKSLSLEVANKNITVNAISPGYIDTNMIRDIPKEILQRIRENIPLQRFGRADEVARLVEFLCEESSSYITGVNYDINGGLYMR